MLNRIIRVRRAAVAPLIGMGYSLLLSTYASAAPGPGDGHDLPEPVSPPDVVINNNTGSATAAPGGTPIDRTINAKAHTSITIGSGDEAVASALATGGTRDPFNPTIGSGGYGDANAFATNNGDGTAYASADSFGGNGSSTPINGAGGRSLSRATAVGGIGTTTAASNADGGDAGNSQDGSAAASGWADARSVAIGNGFVIAASNAKAGTSTPSFAATAQTSDAFASSTVTFANTGSVITATSYIPQAPETATRNPITASTLSSFSSEASSTALGTYAGNSAHGFAKPSAANTEPSAIVDIFTAFGSESSPISNPEQIVGYGNLAAKATTVNDAYASFSSVNFQFQEDEIGDSVVLGFYGAAPLFETGAGSFSDDVDVQFQILLNGTPIRDTWVTGDLTDLFSNGYYFLDGIDGVDGYADLTFKMSASSNVPFEDWTGFGGSFVIAQNLENASVPEPTALGLIAVASVGLLSRRRRVI